MPKLYMYNMCPLWIREIGKEKGEVSREKRHVFRTVP